MVLKDSHPTKKQPLHTVFEELSERVGTDELHVEMVEGEHQRTVAPAIKVMGGLLFCDSVAIEEHTAPGFYRSHDHRLGGAVRLDNEALLFLTLRSIYRLPRLGNGYLTEDGFQSPYSPTREILVS